MPEIIITPSCNWTWICILHTFTEFIFTFTVSQFLINQNTIEFASLLFTTLKIWHTTRFHRFYRFLIVNDELRGKIDYVTRCDWHINFWTIFDVIFWKKFKLIKIKEMGLFGVIRFLTFENIVENHYKTIALLGKFRIKIIFWRCRLHTPNADANDYKNQQWNSLHDHF